MFFLLQGLRLRARFSGCYIEQEAKEAIEERKESFRILENIAVSTIKFKQ